MHVCLYVCNTHTAALLPPPHTGGSTPVCSSVQAPVLLSSSAVLPSPTWQYSVLCQWRAPMALPEGTRTLVLSTIIIILKNDRCSKREQNNILKADRSWRRASRWAKSSLCSWQPSPKPCRSCQAPDPPGRSSSPSLSRGTPPTQLWTASTLMVSALRLI